MTSHLSHPTYRPDIDGLRAIAVLSVVTFHAFPAWMKGGFIGVDIFFVISGFLISTIIFENLENGTFSFAEFYRRRINRILPALLIVFMTSLIFGWFALLADEYKQLGKHIFAGATFVSNFILWSEAGYFDNTAETKPLLHLWSLGIEEQFYIIWPLAAWISWKKKFNPTTLIIISIIASFILNIRGIEKDSTATFYSPQTRFWELLIGSAVANYLSLKKMSFADKKSEIKDRTSKAIIKKNQKSGPTVLSTTSSAIGITLLTYGFWHISKDTSFPGNWALIPVLGASLIIIAGPNAWINRNILSNKIIVWFGLISFPLYLWHWPLLSFARIIEGSTPSINIRIAAVILSIGLAWLTYKFIEFPMRSNKGNKAKATALIALLIAIGLIGYHIHLNDGYENRASIKGIVNNKNELIRTPISDEECLSYINLREPLFPYCRFKNENSDETVAIIGDSHAHVAYPGIADFLSTRGKNTVLLANSSCPPFIGIPTGNNETELEACRRRTEQLIRIIESKKDISKVFVFTRGPIYTTNTEPLTGKIKIGANTIPLENFANSAKASFDRLISKGKHIYYVSENPELNFHPDACLTRPFKKTINNCVIEKDFTYIRQAEYREAISKIKGITFIDSLPVFCPTETCIIFDKNGALLYADDDHLSISGSRFQVNNLLRPYLD